MFGDAYDWCRDLLLGFLWSTDQVESKIVFSVLILLLAGLVRTLLRRALARGHQDDPVYRYRWRKITGYGTGAVVVLLLTAVWADRIGSFSTFLGLFSAGLAIALRDLVASFAGWVFLMVMHPFEVGDRVQVGEHRGDVIDIRVFKFTLMEIGGWVDADQSTGRVVHLPNSLVISQVLVNYSRGFNFIWNELPVVVTFESDWRRAKEILTEVVNRHAADFTDKAHEQVRRTGDRYLVFYRTLTPIVWTRVVDVGVELTLRHLCPPRQRRSISEKMWEDILDRFAEEPTIDLAYPTVRYYDNRHEGKPPLRADAPVRAGGE
ncbi:MAG: mechanosensitive ion channel family protein [Acidobacteriota bacterium]